MQIVRVYSGDDGESHFHDMSRDELEAYLPKEGVGPITLHRLNSPSVNDFHPGPPNPQYLVFLAGIVEVEIGDGSIRRFLPGDILIAEDSTGHGHITRGMGADPRVSFHVQLPRNS